MSIENRVNQLQKKVNRLMSLFAVVLIAAILIGVLYSGSPEAAARGNQSANIVKAQKFSVVDSSGREVAILGTTQGETGLVLNNDKSQIVLGAANAGTGLFVFDSNKAVRVGSVYIPGKDQSMMALGDSRGNMEWTAP